MARSATDAGLDFARPFTLPMGLRLLVPGYPQLFWGRPELGTFLLGTYASSLTVGLFTWGTRCGWLLLGSAFLVHVVSLAAALHQRSFPPFAPRLTFASATSVLGLAYSPLLAVALAMAWPVPGNPASPEGYLANRWAYRRLEPATGHWVCYLGSPGEGGLQVGLLRACAGQRIDYRDGSWWLGGQFLAHSIEGLDTPPAVPTASLSSQLVPPGHELVEPATSSFSSHRQYPAGALVQVPTRQIQGRVWARHWPFWNRQWLGSLPDH